MPPFRHVEVEGTRAIIWALRHNDERVKTWMKVLVVDLGEHALGVMRIYAPRGESGYLHEHLGMSGVEHVPGGAGRGAYQTVAGVRRGTSLHPIFVERGTAYRDNELIRDMSVPSDPGRIYPVNASALKIQKKGEDVRYRASVKGQRPQPFAYMAFTQTAVYAEGRIRTAASLFEKVNDTAL